MAGPQPRSPIADGDTRSVMPNTPASRAIADIGETRSPGTATASSSTHCQRLSRLGIEAVSLLQMPPRRVDDLEYAPRIFELTLIVATLLCSLVAGFLFAFAVVAMPGIRTLGDGEFLRAFQAMDRVIQNNQPLFLVVWVGSVVALVASAALGLGGLDGPGRLLLIGAVILYLLGVQLPTVAANIPLNNRVQTLEIDRLDEPERAAARQAFEGRWNRWNRLRTVLACVVALLLLVLLSRL